MGLLTGETVTVLRPEFTTDAHGNEVADWSDATETDVPGVAIGPGATDEDGTDRQASIDNVTFYMPTGTDVLPSDRIEARGVTYEVYGVPRDWRSPFTGRRPGLAVPARVVNG